MENPLTIDESSLRSLRDRSKKITIGIRRQINFQLATVDLITDLQLSSTTTICQTPPPSDIVVFIHESLGHEFMLFLPPWVVSENRLIRMNLAHVCRIHNLLPGKPRQSYNYGFYVRGFWRGLPGIFINEKKIVVQNRHVSTKGIKIETACIAWYCEILWNFHMVYLKWRRQPQPYDHSFIEPGSQPAIHHSVTHSLKLWRYCIERRLKFVSMYFASQLIWCQIKTLSCDLHVSFGRIYKVYTCSLNTVTFNELVGLACLIFVICIFTVAMWWHAKERCRNFGEYSFHLIKFGLLCLGF